MFRYLTLKHNFSQKTETWDLAVQYSTFINDSWDVLEKYFWNVYQNMPANTCTFACAVLNISLFSDYLSFSLHYIFSCPQTAWLSDCQQVRAYFKTPSLDTSFACTEKPIFTVGEGRDCDAEENLCSVGLEADNIDPQSSIALREQLTDSVNPPDANTGEGKERVKEKSWINKLLKVEETCWENVLNV